MPGAERYSRKRGSSKSPERISNCIYLGRNPPVLINLRLIAPRGFLFLLMASQSSGHTKDSLVALFVH